MAFTCYKCNSVDVQEEFERCPPCEQQHKELCAKLDAKPKQHIEKVKVELMAIKETKQGILVTTYIDREDARNMGIEFVPSR